MKKLLYIVAVVGIVSFVSCKKDYTCTCTVHDTSGTIPDVSTSTTIHDKKSAATDACTKLNSTVGTLTNTCVIK